MFNSGIMLRLGKTANIHRQFEECCLTFGCPANWITYAKNKASGIADEFEAIWGHVRKDDKRLSQICDDGAPLNSSNSLWVSEDKNNNDLIYVRYIYFCLTPSLCFYSRPIHDEVTRWEQEHGEKIDHYDIDLRPYINSLGLDENDSSFLIIRYPGQLYQEIKEQIPQALKDAGNIIDFSGFDVNDPLCIRYVDYSLDIKKIFFADNLRSYNPLFTKRPEYRDQREARIFIRNVNFINYPLIDKDLYNPHNFELSIYLPNLHNYAIEVPAKDKHILRFDSFDEERKNYYINI